MSVDYEKEFTNVIEAFVVEEDREVALGDDLTRAIFYSGVVTGLTASARRGQADVESILQMSVFSQEGFDA